MNADELFVKAAEHFGRLVGHINDNGQWDQSTPNSDWSVRDLVNHLVAELVWMPPLLGGQTIAEVGNKFDGDLLGEDPLAAWHKALAEAKAAVRQPGAMGETVHLSFGDTPGGEYAKQVAGDLTIHSWDLAKAIGQDTKLPDELVEMTWEVFGPAAEGARAGGSFGPAVEVPEGASRQDKLLALTGRNPSWSAN